MPSDLFQRLREAVAGTALAEPLATNAAVFAQRRGHDQAARRIGDLALRGLARALATQPEAAGFLSHRGAFLERLAAAGPETLHEREKSLADDAHVIAAEDLEDALDAMRLRQREETVFAACIDLAGLSAFEDVAGFLSVLAETTTEIALALARKTTSSDEPFSVLGMGKIGGREFTYHSDLDLVFLYRGGAENVTGASRIAQRLINYLTTRTGAGTAYAVDTRLRPSGHQGMLVTSFRGFESYQTGSAQSWEHLAMLRARAIAGEHEEVAALLARIREEILAREGSPWPHLAELRARVVAQRADLDTEVVDYKTGAGGLMDVDFIAGGALLERGTDRFPALPSVRAMLEACAASQRIAALLADHRSLRLLEARARWISGRGTEEVRCHDDTLPLVAQLLEPDLEAGELLDRIARARQRIRSCFDAVIAAGTVGALEEAENPPQG